MQNPVRVQTLVAQELLIELLASLAQDCAD